jgi:hypothetical protein
VADGPDAPGDEWCEESEVAVSGRAGSSTLGVLSDETRGVMRPEKFLVMAPMKSWSLALGGPSRREGASWSVWVAPSGRSGPSRPSSSDRAIEKTDDGQGREGSGNKSTAKMQQMQSRRRAELEVDGRWKG